jgi:hypothetical protein
MTQHIDLKKIEKQAYRFTFKDGLYDIAYGTLLVSFAIAPVLREIIYLGYIPFMVLPAPLILILGKRYITIPRIGIAKFSLNRAKNKRKIRLLTAILFPLSLLTVILTAYGIFNVQIGGYIVPLAAGIFALILLSSVAYIIDYPHFYLYAISIGLGIPLAELLEPITGEPLDYILSFGISGILILTYGVITVIKFVKQYPKPIQELSNAQG